MRTDLHLISGGIARLTNCITLHGPSLVLSDHCQCPGDHPHWNRIGSTASCWKSHTVSDSSILNIILLMQVCALRSNSKIDHITENYQKILDSIRGLKEQIRWTLENDSGAINDLASMVSPRPCLLCPYSLRLPSKLDHMSSRGRSNDCGSLYDNGLKYIPHVEGIPELEPYVKKERRGFCHHSTARLLCPHHL